MTYGTVPIQGKIDDSQLTWYVRLHGTVRGILYSLNLEKNGRDLVGLMDHPMALDNYLVVCIWLMLTWSQYNSPDIKSPFIYQLQDFREWHSTAAVQNWF